MLAATAFYAGLVMAALGVTVAVAAFFAPAPETRVQARSSHLDDFVPVWQFNEVHSRRIAAPPAVVYKAIEEVRGDEIRLLGTLGRIRNFGRGLPSGLRARPLLDKSSNGAFILLADDPPSEVVLGRIVGAPPGGPYRPTPEFIRDPPDGFSVAAINFRVVSDGAGGSIVTTETRVRSNGVRARRRFAKYWRVIYPGSALLRVMWLRAIEKKAARERGPNTEYRSPSTD